MCLPSVVAQSGDDVLTQRASNENLKFPLCGPLERLLAFDSFLPHQKPAVSYLKKTALILI